MAADTIVIAGKAIEVWPGHQKLLRSGDESFPLLRTRFDDVADYHPGLIARVLQMAEEPHLARQYSRSLGGTKLYHLGRWNCAEADLINARAIAFFKRAMGCSDAVVDISWANIYRCGDYTMPHSHIRSTASLVYFLDEGDPDPKDSNSGRFCVVDPRFGPCCKIEPNYMTNPFTPNTSAGSMLLFPGALIHCVNPYTGNRPRVSLSWNINTKALPGSVWEVLQQPDPAA